MTKYYKVMNNDETHNGLNSDIWEFQHYGGHGLYYAKEDILAFIRNDSRYTGHYQQRVCSSFNKR